MEIKRVTFECPMPLYKRIEEHVRKENEKSAITGKKYFEKHLLIEACSEFLTKKGSA